MLKYIDTRSTKGFTLVELMVVIAIIGILAAIGIPKLIGYMKVAETTEAIQMIDRINAALRGYVAERSGSLDVGKIADYLNTKGLSVASDTDANTLASAIPTLTLPPNPHFRYVVYAKSSSTDPADSSAELVTCIKAQAISVTSDENATVTPAEPERFVLVSSIPAGLDSGGLPADGWENYISRLNYLSGEIPSDSGACQGEGTGII
jgi:prepilin-type N-terminal cleavage/methylation domain-containing protein